MKELCIKSIPLILTCLIMSCKDKNTSQIYVANSHVHANQMEEHSHDKYFEAYNLEDEKFGTKTKVSITTEERIMVTNSLPNHATGKFPNVGNPNTISAQNRTFNFPLNPKYTGKARWVREPGIAINGIKFEPGTGEVVVCESGENYRVEAFQDIINMGLDFNHAHVQPTGAYHYHGTPTSVINKFDTGLDLVHIGFAHDGFPIYYSKSNVYKPSFKLVEGKREGDNCSYNRPGITVDIPDYGHHDGTFNSDFEFVANSGDLDECNGITIDGKYMYLVTAEFPYISRCLMGEFQSQERGGPPQGSGQGVRSQRGAPPNVKQIFEGMDANTDEKISNKESAGPLQQKFSEVDTNNDGYISMDELEKDLSQRGKRPKRP